jgi:predicted O-methyltransferase YrrM/GT2 family glycosyltransferase
MFIEGRSLKKKISLAVTTYRTQSYYTHACLESIRTWKTNQHELIVACHDQSLLLEFYLRSCLQEGLIDTLLFTDHDYGHTRGVNLCFEKAQGELIFNIANDMLIGDAIVGDCAIKLARSSIGIVGWHWYSEGATWQSDGTLKHDLRDATDPFLTSEHEGNIRGSHWFTGKLFEGLGGPKWIQLCNTAFFGMRKEVWDHIGGFDYEKYPHYWADDFLGYATLDQGLDVIHFDPEFRQRPYFAEFAYDNMDVEDRHRDEDRIALPPALESFTHYLSGGLSEAERQLLYQLARSLGPHKTVLHVGLWRGAGLVLFLKAMQNQPAEFIGIDCFEDGEVSQFSMQPPVSEAECVGNVVPFLATHHNLRLISANTLELNEFPSADVIFIDAGHTKECIEHDVRLAKEAIKPGGILIFHDYGQPSWPDVQETIDANFKVCQIRTFDTLAVIQLNENEVSISSGDSHLQKVCLEVRNQ